MDAKSVLEFAKKNNAKILDIRFTDLPGVWQHVSYPIGELVEGSFKDGFGFDASSIRGWQSIHESDMLLIPDPSTAFMDPFRDAPTLVMIADAVEPASKEPYKRDPRNIAKKAEAHVVKSGVADLTPSSPPPRSLTNAILATLPKRPRPMWSSPVLPTRLSSAPKPN